MTQTKLERLQIIFDRDHGTSCEGWYVRMREQSTAARQGQEIDEPVDVAIPEDPTSERQQATLRGEARRVARANGYHVPSSLAVEIL